jgi:hypothetical protein
MKSIRTVIVPSTTARERRVALTAGFQEILASLDEDLLPKSTALLNDISTAGGQLCEAGVTGCGTFRR